MLTQFYNEWTKKDEMNMCASLHIICDKLPDILVLLKKHNHNAKLTGKFPFFLIFKVWSMLVNFLKNKKFKTINILIHDLVCPTGNFLAI